MTPGEVAEKGWEAFDRASRLLSDEQFIEACEELLLSAESAIDAKREEMS